VREVPDYQLIHLQLFNHWQNCLHLSNSMYKSTCRWRFCFSHGIPLSPLPPSVSFMAPFTLYNLLLWNIETYKVSDRDWNEPCSSVSIFGCQSISFHEVEISFCHQLLINPGTHSASCPVDIWAPSLGIEQPGHDNNHSLPPSAGS
jgi:hypothetical protein